MKPAKNFTGSLVVATALKTIAWINLVCGLLFIILVAIGFSQIPLFADLDTTLKISWILGTTIYLAFTTSLIFAAGYGLEMARDTNYRINLQVQIAARTLGMAQSASAPGPGYAPTPASVQPAQGTTYSPFPAQPQAPQPGQPLQ